MLEETNGESLPLVLIEGTPVALKMLAELFEDLADDEPIKQHADGREVLFDGRLGGRGLKPLDVGRDVHGFDIGELADLMLLDPGEEGACSPIIGHARVLIADLGGEEFEEPARSMITGIANRSRYRKRAA